jgi:hypothetical protein
VSFPATLALVLAVAIPLELLRAYRWRDDVAEGWAREHGVALTDESRPLVTRHLRRARVLRTWGAVTGAVLPTAVEYALSGRVVVLGFGTDGDSTPLGFGTIFVGYLIGALVAEISFTRPVAHGRRAASLAPRRLTDYLPRRVVVAQRALAAAGALGVVAFAAVPYASSVDPPGVAAAAVWAAAVLAFAAGLEAIERRLVARPQPFATPAMIAADDALRAHSIRAVAGAGLALLLLLGSGVSLALQASDVAALRIVMVVPAAVCLVLSVLVCPAMGESAWRVQRPDRPSPAASA